MNILLINHYAGSPDMGMEFRPYYFAKEWTKLGHTVSIIAADYSHLRRKNPDIENDFQCENIDGIDYYWIKTRAYERNGAKRAITMAQFIGKLLLSAKKLTKVISPDVVICSSTYPLDTYVGQKIKKISKKPVKLIHEVHDMWPISPVEIGGMSEKHPFIKVMQMGENSFCKNSDVIVSLLPAAKDYFVEHGMKADKFRHVANGVLLSEWENYKHIPEEISNHFIKNKREGKFNLCFFGSLHKTYNLDVFIKSIIDMKREDLAVTFIGPGHDKAELIGMAKGYESLIQFFDPIPKTSIPDLFNYIDGVFIGAKSQKIFRFGICMNKLFDSMMGGKPILYMVDAPNNYVTEYDCGVSVEGNSQKDLENGIERLLALPESEKKRLGDNGRRAAMKVFNYTSLAKKFLDIMEE